MIPTYPPSGAETWGPKGQADPLVTAHLDVVQARQIREGIAAQHEEAGPNPVGEDAPTRRLGNMAWGVETHHRALELEVDSQRVLSNQFDLDTRGTCETDRCRSRSCCRLAAG